jgi:hypothetical protein
VPSKGAPHSFTYWTGLAIAALTWILSTYLILTTLVAVYRFYCPVPYGDMWWFVRDMARLNSHQVGLSYLWEQHSEHRIVLPRLIFWTDVHLDHFRGIFTTLCSSLLLVGEGLLLSFSFARIVKSSVASKVAYAALVFGIANREPHVPLPSSVPTRFLHGLSFHIVDPSSLSVCTTPMDLFGNGNRHGCLRDAISRMWVVGLAGSAISLLH